MTVIDALIVAVVALQVLDGWTTYKVLRSGKGTEANPVVRKVIERLGVYPGLMAVKGGAIVCVIVARQYGVWVGDVAIYVLALAVVLYVVVVAQNWKVMKS